MKIKKITDVEKEITQIEKELKNNSNLKRDDKKRFTDNKIGKLNNRIEFLKGLILYLQSNPSPEYLHKEVERIEKSINNAVSGYEHWTKFNAPKDVDPKKYKALYSSTVGLGKLNKQLKTVKYLIAA